jgi:hypothetical protein
MADMIFSGGITFTGGFSITLPPPAQATAGWYGTGTPNPNSLERQMFATDTATATYRATLTVSTNRAAGVFTLDYGWIGSGLNSGTPFNLSTVQRITFASDTSASSVRGPLNVALYGPAATGNTTDGWFAGGRLNAPSYAPQSTVQRITYATDTATASIRGPLSSARYAQAAAGTATDGWIIGGYGGTPEAILAQVNRITYATDTETASVRGNLGTPMTSLSACSDGTTYAWAAGGSGPAGKSSLVQRITYATDTATASTKGPLSLARFALSSATQNDTNGWFAGGYVPGPPGYQTSRIDRITFATDTATASVRGPLSQTGYNIVGLSGVA